MVTSRSRVCACGVAGQILQAVLTTTSSVGPNGTRWSPMRWLPTRPRTRVSQRPNTIAARLCASAATSWFQPCAERAEGERVDPGRQPGADRERLHPEGAAQLLVLVLGVAQDQGAVAEVHHPQQQRLDGGGLAAAGFAEDEHVGVGDRDVSSRTQPSGSA